MRDILGYVRRDLRRRKAVLSARRTPTACSRQVSPNTRKARSTSGRARRSKPALPRGSGRVFCEALRRAGGRQRARRQRSAGRIYRQEHPVPRRPPASVGGPCCRSARQTACRPRPSAAPASRRQDHHRLERPHDFRVRPRRAGARRRRHLDDARRAADFIRQHLYRETDGILLRSYREGPAPVAGFADDYAFLIQGLLDLYEAGFDLAHSRWAERLQTKQDELFLDPKPADTFRRSERRQRAVAHEGGPRRRGAEREFAFRRSTSRGWRR